MIHIDQVTVTYHDAGRPTLRDVNVRISEGELCLVVGGTGVGKSTLLGVMNGLVPHFTGGHLEGRVEVGGRDTRHHPPRELADLVGVVGQDPLAGFVTDRVEDELAYGMELLAVDPLAMRKRLEEVLDLLGIADLRNRSLRALSGGQQQRVALGSVLTSLPRILVLDEPTSALDPTAAEDVLAAVTRLVHDLGVTVVMAEHRLERAVQYADRILHLPGDGSVRDGPPAEVLATSDIAPPVVHLGRLAGWQPLPLSIRDARRRAGPLRSALEGAERRSIRSTATRSERVKVRDLTVRHGAVTAVDRVDLTLRRGEITALMGRNGSGKSSMLWAIQGTGPRTRGRIVIDGTNHDDAAGGRGTVGLVPQTPSDLLYLHTVDEELHAADTESEAAAGTAAGLLDRILPRVDRTCHPRDLSEGQKLALVLAVQLTPDPTVLLLDEPTRGLDYRAKARLGKVLRELADKGRTVVVATHDVELVADLADRVLLMAEGELVADGPTAAVIAASPTFAPQVARILAPSTWLTVEEVRDGLAVAERR